jgi:hypothetical protein
MFNVIGGQNVDISVRCQSFFSKTSSKDAWIWSILEDRGGKECSLGMVVGVLPLVALDRCSIHLGSHKHHRVFSMQESSAFL